MNCPNCDAPKLRTTETFQLPRKTIRTKACEACKWKFTSHEEISDELLIPELVRNFKSKRKK